MRLAMRSTHSLYNPRPSSPTLSSPRLLSPNLSSPRMSSRRISSPKLWGVYGKGWPHSRRFCSRLS